MSSTRPGKPVSRDVANGHQLAGRGRRSLRPPRHLGCASTSPAARNRPLVRFTPRALRPHPARMVTHHRGGADVPPEIVSSPAPSHRRPGLGLTSEINLLTANLEASEPSEPASRSMPPLAPPSPRPAGPSRPVVEVCGIAFAQVLLNFGNPPGEVPTQPSFGKEPQAGRGMLANPLTIDELTHAPACTVGNEASHDRPPHDCQHIPQRVRQLLPSQPVHIPVSQFTHLQPGDRTGDHDHPVRNCRSQPTPEYIGGKG